MVNVAEKQWEILHKIMTNLSTSLSSSLINMRDMRRRLGKDGLQNSLRVVVNGWVSHRQAHNL